MTEVKTHLRARASGVLFLLLYTKYENDRLYKAIFIPVMDAVSRVPFWLKHKKNSNRTLATT